MTDYTQRPKEEEEGVPFFPIHLMKEVIVAFLVIGLLISLAVLVPFLLHATANSLETPAHIKPEWYFLPVYQLIKYVPEVVGVVGMGIIALLFVIFPFLETNPSARARDRKTAIRVGAAIVVVTLVLGVIGHFSDGDVTIFGKTYHITAVGLPVAAEEAAHD